VFPVSGDWTAARAEEYLTDRRIPVRLACRTPDGGLWMLSLWYLVRDGALHCATGADADVVRYLREDPSVAFEVSDNEPPYCGVRGAGTATITPDEGKALLRELMERYLGGTDHELGRKLLHPDREEVHLRIDPERAYTWDFGDRMGDAVADSGTGTTGDAED
jgi:nitroimidazol reductase NimA-like FMN-containing flavoprotein (pyridoxamine 5'-phosphate oxidase superfamily)